MRALLLLLGLLLGMAAASASGPEGDAPPEERPAARAFDAQRLEQIRAENDYDRDLRLAPSPWERFKEWLKERIRELLGSRAGAFVTANLVYLTTFLAIVLAIAVLSRHGLHRVFHGAPRSMATAAAAEEDIRGTDLPALIARAEQEGDLRQAIRLHYLLVLRQLVDQGELTWSPERTDSEYLAQLRDPGLRARFARAARIFQWVWYGHALVDRAAYGSLREPFTAFGQPPAP